jgi:hypothetical protein
VNAEWADYVASPAFQELKAKRGNDELLLRRLVSQHGTAATHGVVDVVSNDVDVDLIRRLTRRFGLEGVHRLIDELDRGGLGMGG